MKPIFAALLLPALALATPAAAPAKGKAKVAVPTLNITVTNDRFMPSQLTMRSGRPYILRLRNTSDRKHNFSSPTFFKFARVAQADSGWVKNNRVELAAGQSATLHIVAPDTPNSHYEFRSTSIVDAVENLKGDILVR